MRLLYKISTFLILALGLLHVSLTPVLFKRFAQDTMWFASGGVMLIFISFMNFVLMRDAGKDRVVRLLCYITNLIGLGFASTMLVLDWLRATPSALSFFVIFLFIFECVAAFWFGSRRSTDVT